MGINASKRKKYSVMNRYQRRWGNYEGETNSRNIETGDMDTPVYQPQGHPGEYMNFCESDNIDPDSVWQPRRKNEDLHTLDCKDMYLASADTLTNVRGELNGETLELVIRETVFDGLDVMGDTSYEEPKFNDASMTKDLYSFTMASSETNIKQLADIDAQQTIDARKYLELDTPARPQRRLHRYEEMVIIFEPLIVQNVIARHLIPHLTFLEDADKVNVIADRSPRSAVLYIIDELKNNHKDPGRWKQFIEALERCEYKYIAGLLQGEKPVDHSYQREYLKIIKPILRTNISPIELAEVLWSADVISDEDKEEVQQMHNNFGTLAATDRLLDRVPRKHRYWYSHLIEGLRKVKMEHAAEMLDIPELRDTSDSKVYYTDDYVEPLTRKQSTQSIASADPRHQPSEIQLNDAQSRDAVASGTEQAEDYEDITLLKEYIQYGLPPPPSDTHLSSVTHKVEQIVSPENSRCNTLTSILTQQDGKTAIQLQPKDSSLPLGFRYINKTNEAERETILPPPLPKRSNRQRNGHTIRQELPQPKFKSSEQDEDCNDNLNAYGAELSRPQRTLSLSEGIEKDYNDFEVVGLQYPTNKIDASPPLPMPFFDLSKAGKHTQQLPSKPFGKRPMPLPRIKTLSTDTHERPGTKEVGFEERYYDDGYTEVDDKPSPVIDDDEFEEVTNDGEEIESFKKKKVRKNVEKCADTKVHEIANSRARGNKFDISKPSSQKKKKTFKKLAQSRKRKRGAFIRKIFHLRNLGQPSNADEEEISSEKEKGAVQLNKNRQRTSKRSRSLPLQLTEATESSIEYYSQPFQDEIRKTEKTLPVSLVDVYEPDNRDTDSRTKLADTHQRLDENKLREIFNICRKRHGIDQEGTKSDMNIHELSQDEIHPEIKPLLKDVQQQKEELTVLVQQEPVLKAKVEIQTDINEKLKQKRILLMQFDIKAKEASALKEVAANPCYHSDLETNNPELLQNYDAQITSARDMTVEENFLEKPDGILTTITEEADVIINKTDQDVIYKDSAFYSYSERL